MAKCLKQEIIWQLLVWAFLCELLDQKANHICLQLEELVDVISPGIQNLAFKATAGDIVNRIGWQHILPFRIDIRQASFFTKYLPLTQYQSLHKFLFIRGLFQH